MAASTSALRLPSPRVPDPMDAPALRWGIVSTGHIAQQFADTLERGTASRVAAVCSRTRESAERFAAQHEGAAAFDDLEQMVRTQELDAVYIASPHAQHHALALPALRAGIPALVEKAFTLNLSQAQELTEAARASGAFLMEAMWARFLPQADVLRRTVADGLLGDLVLVRADHGQHFPPDPRHRLHDPAQGGGALLDLGVYPISFAQMLIGDLQDPLIAGDLAETGVDASVLLLARGADGARAALTTTLRARTRNTAQVTGTAGRADLSDAFYAPGTLRVELEDGRTGEFRHPGDPDLGMAYEAAEVARCLADGLIESPVMPWVDTLSVMGRMDAVRRALGVRYPGEESLPPAAAERSGEVGR